ncbi:MAG: hypothetical protein AAF539_08485 [Planctomycetota bacterium]
MSQITNPSKGSPKAQLESLVGEFFDPIGALGTFDLAHHLPAPFDELLDHEGHMTVTVEAFHRSLVDVVVHRTRIDEAAGDDDRPRAYLREITLTSRASKKVVQYGIVRLDPSALAMDVWQEIASQSTPLGRVLIDHSVMRDVKLCQLWKVTAGPRLANCLTLDEGEVTYGRTAMIYCDEKPAIELLEIVRSP